MRTISTVAFAAAIIGLATTANAAALGGAGLARGGMGGTLSGGSPGMPHSFDPASGKIPDPGQGKVQGNCVGVFLPAYGMYPGAPGTAPNHHAGFYTVCK